MHTASSLSRRAVLLGAAALAAPFALGAVQPAHGEALGVDPATAGRVAERVGRFLAEFSAPAASLAYARNGAVTFLGAYGLADPYSGEALTTGHRFRIASVTKPITAAAVILLAERGRVRIDQAVFGPGGLLGARFPIDAGHPRSDWLQAVTVDHLLTHTAGGWASDGNDPMFRNGAYGHDDLIAATLREAPLQSPPGSSHAYSNFGYCLLGRVIEAASGQGYARFVHSELLGPSGAAGMEIGGSAPGERRAGEVVYLGQGGENPHGFNLARMDSHGGWIGSAADLVRVAQRINGDDGVADLIGPQGIGLMRAPSGASQSYGRGWGISPRHGNRWHLGSLPGSVSMLALIAGGTAFAGLVNTRTRDGRDAALGLETLLWDVHGIVYG